MSENKPVQVRLPDNEKKWLSQRGNGSVSEGVRRCMELAHILEINGVKNIDDLYKLLYLKKPA